MFCGLTIHYLSIFAARLSVWRDSEQLHSSLLEPFKYSWRSSIVPTNLPSLVCHLLFSSHTHTHPSIRSWMPCPIWKQRLMDLGSGSICSALLLFSEVWPCGWNAGGPSHANNGILKAFLSFGHTWVPRDPSVLWNGVAGMWGLRVNPPPRHTHTYTLLPGNTCGFWKVCFEAKQNLALASSRTFCGWSTCSAPSVNWSGMGER